MQRLIDFHSHILPGVDDGSQSIGESLAMLQAEAQQGVTHVVATPHFYAQNDSPRRFLSRRAAGLDELQSTVSGHEGLPQICVGAEVHYFAGMSESEALSELTIGESKYILVEMPQAPWSETMYRELEWIYTKQGLVPVLAHIDRYLSRFMNGRMLQRLSELPILVQANASFFADRASQKMALKMLAQGQIHVLGSDCHNMTGRVPNLSEAARVIIQKIGRTEGVELLRQMYEYECEILNII